jgi:hypothetical protein
MIALPKALNSSVFTLRETLLKIKSLAIKARLPNAVNIVID